MFNNFVFSSSCDEQTLTALNFTPNTDVSSHNFFASSSDSDESESETDSELSGSGEEDFYPDLEDYEHNV